MTIGEKITVLRNAAGMSQDALADNLSVSRQSVSKWEMDQALPQIDKVLQLCQIFNVSTDELLYDKIAINRSPAGAPVKNKYFGTDGRLRYGVSWIRQPYGCRRVFCSGYSYDCYL